MKKYIIVKNGIDGKFTHLTEGGEWSASKQSAEKFNNKTALLIVSLLCDNVKYINDSIFPYEA